MGDSFKFGLFVTLLAVVMQCKLSIFDLYENIGFKDVIIFVLICCPIMTLLYEYYFKD